MLSLIVSHIIGLTRKERYKLNKGGSVTVVGTSTPVWFEKNNTSEPATEVFAIYKITNKKNGQPIKTTAEGFEMNLPQSNPEAEKEIKSLAIPESILEALGIGKKLPDASSLLDFQDGGSEFLHFKQFARSKLIVEGEKTKIPLNIIHCVEIKPIEDIEETLT